VSDGPTPLGEVNVRDLLDPELAPFLAGFELPPLDTEGLASLRGSFEMPGLSDAVVRTEHLVPGDPPVPVRVHRAAGTEGPQPAVVTIHGGGYVLGSYDLDDPLLDAWCQAFGVVGISVEYRLAPEHPYPGPLEDCYAALRWTHDNADQLGVDRERIGVYGVSAGGGLAAALALLARDRSEHPLAFQLLDCPMIDDRQATPSIRADGLYVWDAQSNDFGWRSYLGDLYGSDDVPPYAAAARALDLAGLPPACVVVGSIDGFRDEDVVYAQRLNQAGVPCELHVVAGLPHAYVLAPDARGVRQANQCKDDWLARQLNRSSAARFSGSRPAVDALLRPVAKWARGSRLAARLRRL
jgi:acetyl esterase/lipase